MTPLPELERLAREAKEAAPGEWKALRDEIWYPSAKGGETKLLDIRGWGYFTGKGSGALGLPHDQAMKRQDDLAAYIAAMSPDQCLALIARVRELEAVAVDAREAMGEIHDYKGGADNVLEDDYVMERFNSVHEKLLEVVSPTPSTDEAER